MKSLQSSLLQAEEVPLAHPITASASAPAHLTEPSAPHTNLSTLFLHCGLQTRKMDTLPRCALQREQSLLQSPGELLVIHPGGWPAGLLQCQGILPDPARRWTLNMGTNYGNWTPLSTTSKRMRGGDQVRHAKNIVNGSTCNVRSKSQACLHNQRKSLKLNPPPPSTPPFFFSTGKRERSISFKLKYYQQPSWPQNTHLQQLGQSYSKNISKQHIVVLLKRNNNRL